MGGRGEEVFKTFCRKLPMNPLIVSIIPYKGGGGYLQDHCSFMIKYKPWWLRSYLHASFCIVQTMENIFMITGATDGIGLHTACKVELISIYKLLYRPSNLPNFNLRFKINSIVKIKVIFSWHQLLMYWFFMVGILSDLKLLFGRFKLNLLLSRFTQYLEILVLY